jgi:nuclear transport factor 2 (NTF2) superfamily protein
MTARTPEELDTLIEDAFLQRDRAALDGLFDEGAVLMNGCGVLHGREAIGHAMTESWDRQCTYVARTRQVLQVRDTALVVADAGIHVLRRGADGAGRAQISLLHLDRPTV